MKDDRLELTTPVDARTTVGTKSGYICARLERLGTPGSKKEGSTTVYDVRTKDGETLYHLDQVDLTPTGEPRTDIVYIGDVEARERGDRKALIENINSRLAAARRPWYKKMLGLAA